MDLLTLIVLGLAVAIPVIGLPIITHLADKRSEEEFREILRGLDKPSPVVWVRLKKKRRRRS